MEFYNLSGEDVLKELKSDVKKGLTQAEVTKRLEEYGPNQLQEKEKINPIIMFFGQFKDFIIYILLFAVLISAISGEYVDAVVIMLILLFNAVFGFIQEYKAEKAIEALKKLSGLKARVLRDGKVVEVDAKDLVPGDILKLEEGNKIPADARIIECAGLQVSEASLTGESVSVSKEAKTLKGELTISDRKNMLFSGTAITRGKAFAIVTSTGMGTEIGKIAGMLTEVEDEQTPLQKKLDSLGKVLGIGTIIICIIVFIAGVFKDGIIHELIAGNLTAIQFIFESKEWFLTAVSLAVAAVPEGLPAIVTIALAIGVTKMGKKNALIRKLPSVETLGEATVICSDKTGTLTKNEMTVRVAWTLKNSMRVSGEGYGLEGDVKGTKKLSKDDELLFRIGAICNDAMLNTEGEHVEIVGDPTEAALLVSAEKMGIAHAGVKKAFKVVNEEPFDSVRKMMSIAGTDGKKSVVYSKGAPEKVLEKCTKILVGGKVRKLTPKDKKEILHENQQFAEAALRVLGFAYKDYKKGAALEKDLIFVGLQGMIDPPHSEVKDAIRRCKKAGIRVIMITGDNVHTATGIAREIGIEGASMEGAAFDKLSAAGQQKAIREVSIFARVEPRHKMKIVELLQNDGQVVAMTGDGVNDAPAIKKADLGIAMGITGTDVAKEASAMVLQDDNFTSIVNAIEEGRGIYINIRKFVNYLLSCNVGEVFVIFAAILMGLPLPMSAIMLLWLNLVTDGLPALALSVDPNPKNLMDVPPKRKNEGIMNRSMSFSIIYVSVLITIGVLGLFKWGIGQYGVDAIEHIQTLAFTAIVVLEIARLQAIRSEQNLSTFSNKWLVLAVLCSVGLQLAVLYTPLSQFFGTVALNLVDWGMILGISFVVFILNKLGVYYKQRSAWFKQG